MSGSADNRWNLRYSEGGEFTQFKPPRQLLTRRRDLLPTGGLALDAAGGLGDNAAYLLDCGLRVVAVDLSGVGIRRASQRLPGLMAVQGNLANFHFARASFDVILNFYFLERSLFKAYEYWLKPGGLLFFETLTMPMRTIRTDIDPHFLLEPGELLAAFRHWDVIEYQEGWQAASAIRRKAVASLVARRP